MNIRACTIATLAALLLLLAACSKVTQENFAKVQDGMSEKEVAAILGKPTESTSASITGISGTSSKWVGGDAVIVIRFLNGKVAIKSYDKPAPGK